MVLTDNDVYLAVGVVSLVGLGLGGMYWSLKKEMNRSQKASSVLRESYPILEKIPQGYKKELATGLRRLDLGLPVETLRVDVAGLSERVEIPDGYKEYVRDLSFLILKTSDDAITSTVRNLLHYPLRG